MILVLLYFEKTCFLFSFYLYPLNLSWELWVVLQPSSFTPYSKWITPLPLCSRKLNEAETYRRHDWNYIRVMFARNKWKTVAFIFRTRSVWYLHVFSIYLLLKYYGRKKTQICCVVNHSQNAFKLVECKAKIHSFYGSGTVWL